MKDRSQSVGFAWRKILATCGMTRPARIFYGERPSTLAVHPISPRDLRRGGWIHRKVACH